MALARASAAGFALDDNSLSVLPQRAGARAGRNERLGRYPRESSLSTEFTGRPCFFATPADWRRWLSAHHADTDELWVGFHKRATGKPSITWPEAVDEALCFGWIDGIRRRLDDNSYVIRFTPRRPGSTWSAVNVNRVAELTKRRRMRRPGLRAYEVRKEEKTAIYSFEQRRAVELPPECRSDLEANADAWRFFEAQAPWYQRTATWWIISAKREETRRKRLATLIADSARGRRIAPLNRQQQIKTNTDRTRRTQKRSPKKS